VGFKPLISLNLTNGYPNKNKNNKNKNNKVKSKPLELFELAGKKTGDFKIKFLKIRGSRKKLYINELSRILTGHPV
jgi:hypothetical protein